MNIQQSIDLTYTHIDGNTLPVVTKWYIAMPDAAMSVRTPNAVNMVDLDDAASFGETSKLGCS